MITRICNLFHRNVPAKLICLFVAVVLWVVVMNMQNPTIEGSFTVPLNVVNAPAGYQVSQTDSTVKIKVRGPRSLFVSSTEENFSAYVDLEGAESGKRSYKVQTELPSGFELVSVSPDAEEISLDKIIDKRIRVEIIPTGTSAEGTTTAKIEPAYDSVVVRGPESFVGQISRVVGYVGLSGHDEDFKTSVPLTAINGDGKEVTEVTVLPASLEVSVSLARGLSKAFVSVRPVWTGELSDDLQLGSTKINPAKIEIAGDGKLLKNISSIDTEPIDLAGITQNTEMTVRLALPEGVTVTNKEVKVSITVKKKKAGE